jgi:secreted PhoX family phosphatase
MAGGYSEGFACPDNLAFDRHGNLWMTSDMSEQEIEKGKYKSFGNNSLFYIPMRGRDAGLAIRIANAPMDAEFTGPCFSDDGKTLFLSVQHPGARSARTGKLTSHWPDGGASIPRPGVVMIKGPLIG